MVKAWPRRIKSHMARRQIRSHVPSDDQRFRGKPGKGSNSGQESCCGGLTIEWLRKLMGSGRYYHYGAPSAAHV
jgi:hypothetical protein